MSTPNQGEIWGDVLCFGGANSERVLRVSEPDFVPGMKHTTKSALALAGGSAVNYATRLLASGIRAQPVIPLFDDDTGQFVLTALNEAANTGKIRPSPAPTIDSANGASTPTTTIIRHGSERTIVSDVTHAAMTVYHEHAMELLASAPRANRAPADVAAVMIGHIQSDRESSPGTRGALTNAIVESFSGRTFILANLGSSQLRLKANQLDAALRGSDLLQVDVAEARLLCEGSDVDPSSLEAILGFLSQRCTTVITMERMGAIAQLRGDPDLVLIWPHFLAPDEMADSTGAGDAFAAGIVSDRLRRGSLNSVDRLAQALDTARSWAAYACTTVGGANGCPSGEDLDRFLEPRPQGDEPLVLRNHSDREWIKLLDRVFA